MKFSVAARLWQHLIVKVNKVSDIRCPKYSMERCVFEKGKKGKVCIRAKWPIRPALNSGFRSMKRLGILLLPPGWEASPSQGYPPAL